MRFLQSLLSYAALALSLTAAFPFLPPASPRTVIQFPNPTWLENLAQTRNGSLLVSVIGRPELLLVHNPGQPSTSSSTLAAFPNKTSVLGITEYAPDVFAVAVGSTTPDSQPVPGTFGVWRIDLRLADQGAGVSKIGDTPNVGLLNGVAGLNKDVILLADSWQGNVLGMNVNTGEYGVVLQDQSLESDFTMGGLPLGVNGLRVQGEYVYYSNTVQRLLGRVKVEKKTGKAVGAFEIIVQGEAISVPDDFAVAQDGSVYVASPVAAPEGDTLQKVSLDGKVELIANVVGPTSAQFGRTLKDKNVVYLSSMGGFGPDGVPKAGGKIVAVDLGKK